MIMEENMQMLTKALGNLKESYIKQGTGETVVRDLFLKQLSTSENEEEVDSESDPPDFKVMNLTPGMWLVILSALVAVLGIGVALIFISPDIRDMLGLTENTCLLENNMMLMELTRPLFECNVCKDIKEFPIETDLSKADFAKKYAYTGIPVLVKGATKNWTAVNTFSYKYFKDIYNSEEEWLDQYEMDPSCQFLPFAAEFYTLREAFNMSDERAAYKDGEKTWYFGWSNCIPEISEKLRKHYNRPSFLPDDSESSAADWIFIGGQGLGAGMHLDNVNRPSWQAQIKGEKSWTLLPAPECEGVCHNISVTVHSGDIIVLDTNQWYHSTLVHPGELSIVIGSEYD